MRCKPCLAQSLLRMRCIVEMTVEAMPWQYFLFFFGAKQKAPPGGPGSSWCSVFSESESTHIISQQGLKMHMMLLRISNIGIAKIVVDCRAICTRDPEQPNEHEYPLTQI